MLTDSGGFQMVSLLKLAKITEDGVTFQSPYDGTHIYEVYSYSRSLFEQNLAEQKAYRRKGEQNFLS